jgi:phosphoribosylformylglycinamidine synthase
VVLNANLRPDALLFGESQSRVLVSLPKAALPRLQELARTADLPFSVLGEVGGTELEIVGYLRISVDMLQEEWRTALGRVLNQQQG